MQTGLTNIADTVVGGNIGQGLSGGQVRTLESLGNISTFVTETTIVCCYSTTPATQRLVLG